MRALLDVNVLVALLDAAHVHHRTATRWLAENQAHGWASCPITLTGCIRVMSSPGYPGDFLASEIAERLSRALAHPAHVFWPADLNPLDRNVVAWQQLAGHRQITDAYLLGLAVRHRGRFVTFDQRVVLETIPGATADHLVVLSERPV